MSLSSDDGSLDDHLESDGLADDCDDSMMIKALPSRPQRGELPGFDRLQTVIVSHDTFVLELQELQYLQQLTEDIEIFEDVGMTDHMKSFIILKSVQCQDKYVAYNYHCLQAYPSVPDFDFLGVNQPGKTGLKCYQDGTNSVWCYDILNTGVFEEISQIFAWGNTGIAYSARALCYNSRCVKRSHWVGEDRKYFRSRYWCAGPPSCSHYPKCLMWGPVRYTKKLAKRLPKRRRLFEGEDSDWIDKVAKK
jgi:hypothetical protein